MNENAPIYFANVVILVVVGRGYVYALLRCLLLYLYHSPNDYALAVLRDHLGHRHENLEDVCSIPLCIV